MFYNCIAGGKISRMSTMEGELSDEEVELGIEKDDGRGSGLTTPDPDQAFVQQHLRYILNHHKLGAWKYIIFCY